jgi:hypothetical protein
LPPFPRSLNPPFHRFQVKPWTRSTPRLIKSVQPSQSTSVLELSGQAKAELGKAMAALAPQFTAQGAAKYRQEKSSGVPQKDLLSAINNASSCRMGVLNFFKPYLIPPPSRRSSDAEAPRLIIKDTNIIWLEPSDGARFNVHFSNDGRRYARAVVPNFGIAVTTGGTLPATKLDEVFSDLENKKPDATNTDEMQPNDTRLTTLPGALDQHTILTQDKLKEMIDLHQFLYLFIALNYFDGASNIVWHTESCQYWDLGVPVDLAMTTAPHFCGSHNRIVRSN